MLGLILPVTTGNCSAVGYAIRMTWLLISMENYFPEVRTAKLTLPPPGTPSVAFQSCGAWWVNSAGGTTVVSGYPMENGQSAYDAAQCAKCHRLGDQSGTTGPDITAVGKRFQAEYLLAAFSPSFQGQPRPLMHRNHPDRRRQCLYWSGRIRKELPASNSNRPIRAPVDRNSR